MGFEQDIEAPLVPVKPDVERSKRCQFIRGLPTAMSSEPSTPADL